MKEEKQDINIKWTTDYNIRQVRNIAILDKSLLSFTTSSNITLQVKK